MKDRFNLLPLLATLPGLGSLWQSYACWQDELFIRSWFHASLGVFLIAFAVVRRFDHGRGGEPR